MCVHTKVCPGATACCPTQLPRAQAHAQALGALSPMARETLPSALAVATSGRPLVIGSGSSLHILLSASLT